ncbi:Serine/threonine-protein kinase [Akanthomyces lecanii RCEF 1005]|uniref:Serine/threonine-protein kinase n=1 Tax=Akanthomyces lecanii RCEF 1005 TaxID=1081108 RepID=A0A168CSG7_CORDF|nr:Serine/threonine-protein kinase [Akanthomyces lecanii RCEF 1005]
MEQPTLFDVHSLSVFTEYPANAKYFRVQAPKCRVEPHHSTMHHRPAQHGRNVTPVPEIRLPPFLRVTLSHRPKYPASGWIFGSDPEACDIVIGKRGQGISGAQFSVSPQEDAGRLIVRNLSHNGTTLEEETEGEVEYVRMEGQRGISDTQSLVIMVSNKTKLKIALPGHHGDSYNMHWAELYADMNREGPTLETLKIAPAPASTYISPYILKSLIAKRPNYVLFRATERRSHRLVVIKRYSSQHREQAGREASFLSRIEHENIVAFEDYDPECGLVFAHFSGRLLSDEHRRASLTYGEFKIASKQLISALQHLHGLTLYHGDFQSDNIAVRQRWPTIEVTLLNFDTRLRATAREYLIQRDMEDLHRWILDFLFGEENPRTDGCQPVNSAKVNQIHSAFETARYDAICDGITHSAALLKELELCPALNGDSPENADRLPLAAGIHSVIDSDQSSLPDTEPCGDTDEVESFFYTHGQQVVTVRKLNGGYEVNLTEILRAARLPRARHTALLRRHTGIGSQRRGGSNEPCWVTLSQGMAITKSLGMDVPKPSDLSRGADITEDPDMNAPKPLSRPRRHAMTRGRVHSSAHSARMEIYQNIATKGGRIR